MPSSEVLDLLESNQEKGLDIFEVEHRRERFGSNVLTQRRGHGPLVRFLLQFNQPLVYILLVAVFITAILQEWADSGVILGVVLVNAVIGSFKVPADMRLLRSRELQVDESALTGESVPVEKGAVQLEHDTVLADRCNMAYSSTLVTYGTGMGVVVATGDNTEIGRISEMISSAEVLATPLTLKIAHFSGILLYVILGMGTLTFLVGTLRGESWLHMFMAAVALAVGAIPEGLPAAMTITLAIGVAKMAKRNAIIRKLPAVETLGSTTVICSDKTGTLTQNQMTVQEVLAAGEKFTISGVGYAPEGRFSQSGTSIDSESWGALIECLKAGLLCNDSRLIKTDNGWRVEGDPTEGALITSGLKAGLSPDAFNHALPRIDSIPFESQHQYMATLHDLGPDQSRLVYLKGSVESIVQRCDTVLDASGERMAVDAASIHAQVEEIAAKGLRVLAFARAELPACTTSVTHEDVTSGLTFLGLQGMIDPPRPAAVAAVSACQAAGIHVKMITGDHAVTASAIAMKVGLYGANEAEAQTQPSVITGKAIGELSDAELLDAAEGTSVFARVTPEQKLRLVEAFQARGNVVAMTGDGVNDAPALRRADIGVAMGITGTEVAREAADMVLMDDNFSSIEAAVEEGRGVFDNLIKFITWTLPTNIGEGLVIIAAVFAGVTLPILPVQILWINMTTAVLLGLMLSFEPKEPGIMRRPPRDPLSPILSGVLMFRICLVGMLLLAGSFGLFEWSRLNGSSDVEARTVAVNVFVMGELFYLFNCRSLTRSMFALGVFSNRWLFAGVGTIVVLQLLFTYAPAMNRMFHSAPIALTEWLLIIGVGFAIYVVIGVEKWFRQSGMKGRQVQRP